MVQNRGIFLLAILVAMTATQARAADDLEAQRLLAQWRNPQTRPEVRKELAEKLLALGEEGPRRLAFAIAQDFPRRRLAYLQKFEKASGQAIRARFKKNEEAEVEQLRKTVLEVVAAANLTKQMIKEKSDPAMKRLEELLSVKRDELLTQSDLAAEREALLEMLAAFSRAAPKVSGEPRKSLPTLPDSAAFDDELRNAESLAATMASPMTDADRKVMLANEELVGKLDPEEARGLRILNQIRLRVGLNALEIDLKLCDAARGHSTDMKEKKFFAHDSPVPGKETPWKRAELAGTRAGAENIYVGSGRGVDAINGWWYSPGHHQNMMGRHKRQGLGRNGNLWTQMFG